MPQVDPIYFAITIAVVIMLATSIRILKEYETRRYFPSRTTGFDPGSRTRLYDTLLDRTDAAD